MLQLAISRKPKRLETQPEARQPLAKAPSRRCPLPVLCRALLWAGCRGRWALVALPSLCQGLRAAAPLPRRSSQQHR